MFLRGLKKYPIDIVKNNSPTPDKIRGGRCKLVVSPSLKGYMLFHVDLCPHSND